MAYDTYPNQQHPQPESQPHVETNDDKWGLTTFNVSGVALNGAVSYGYGAEAAHDQLGTEVPETAQAVTGYINENLEKADALIGSDMMGHVASVAETHPAVATIMFGSVAISSGIKMAIAAKRRRSS